MALYEYIEDYKKCADIEDSNEQSFGMFLKETKDLVQIGRNDLIRIHKFIFED